MKLLVGTIWTLVMFTLEMISLREDVLNNLPRLQMFKLNADGPVVISVKLVLGTVATIC